MDWIATTAVFDPGDQQAPTGVRAATDEPIPCAFWIWRLVAFRVGHDLLDLGGSDTSLRMVILDVLPVGTVPDDRPIVHGDQYISVGYTLGIRVPIGTTLEPPF